MRSIVFLLLCGSLALGQNGPSERVLNLRVEGGLDARFPAALLTSRPVTISFDGTNGDPEQFVIRIWHCDRDWRRTESIFLNDPNQNSIRTQIPYVRAPQGVQNYRYSYTLRLPGTREWERFRYSGNYIVEIWDEGEAHQVGTARIVVAESLLASGAKVWNRQLPSEVAPLNQVNRVAVTYAVPPQDPRDDAPVYAQYIRTVDVYRNREMSRPYRIDVDDQDPETFVEGWGTNAMQFLIGNIPCGNEYRVLDIRSTDLYPPGPLLRPRDGSDVLRWLHQGVRDHNGTSTQVTAGMYADDVEYQFELLVPVVQAPDSVFVVGDFNGWDPSNVWKMGWDPSTGRFVARERLRRGRYDYQYVANGTDWLTLEGNDWRTTNVFTAVIYYRDPRFGGFDRVLGIAQGRSPGGTVATAP